MSPAKTYCSYLIPHHGVWQDSAVGKKLHVDFDASCAPSANSLNDLLLSGLKLQADLSHILIRFRLYVIPICADLVKIYRQILIHPEERHLQHIPWCDNSTKEIQKFEPNTLTYGVKSSAYHALRVLKQLILDEGENFPLAATRVSEDVYVDDLVSGADLFEEAIQLIAELQCLFERGGFSLGKWASSHQELLPEPSQLVKSISYSSELENSVKILSLMWNSVDDSFCYSARIPFTSKPTKRTMLSAIPRTFNPSGLLSPAIFSAKTLIREVWKARIGWKYPLPCEIASQWSKLHQNGTSYHLFESLNIYVLFMRDAL